MEEKPLDLSKKASTNSLGAVEPVTVSRCGSSQCGLSKPMDMEDKPLDLSKKASTDSLEAVGTVTAARCASSHCRLSKPKKKSRWATVKERVKFINSQPSSNKRSTDGTLSPSHSTSKRTTNVKISPSPSTSQKTTDIPISLPPSISEISTDVTLSSSPSTTKISTDVTPSPSPSTRKRSIRATLSHTPSPSKISRDTTLSPSPSINKRSTDVTVSLSPSTSMKSIAVTPSHSPSTSKRSIHANLSHTPSPSKISRDTTLSPSPSIKKRSTDAPVSLSPSASKKSIYVTPSNSPSTSKRSIRANLSHTPSPSKISRDTNLSPSPSTKKRSTDVPVSLSPSTSKRSTNATLSSSPSTSKGSTGTTPPPSPSPSKKSTYVKIAPRPSIGHGNTYLFIAPPPSTFTKTTSNTIGPQPSTYTITTSNITSPIVSTKSERFSVNRPTRSSTKKKSTAVTTSSRPSTSHETASDSISLQHSKNKITMSDSISQTDSTGVRMAGDSTYQCSSTSGVASCPYGSIALQWQYSNDDKRFNLVSAKVRNMNDPPADPGKKIVPPRSITYSFILEKQDAATGMEDTPVAKPCSLQEDRPPEREKKKSILEPKRPSEGLRRFLVLNPSIPDGSKMILEKNVTEMALAKKDNVSNKNNQAILEYHQPMKIYPDTFGRRVVKDAETTTRVNENDKESSISDLSHNENDEKLSFYFYGKENDIVPTDSFSSTVQNYQDHQEFTENLLCDEKVRKDATGTLASSNTIPVQEDATKSSISDMSINENHEKITLYYYKEEKDVDPFFTATITNYQDNHEFTVDSSCDEKDRKDDTGTFESTSTFPFHENTTESSISDISINENSSLSSVRMPQGSEETVPHSYHDDDNRGDDTITVPLYPNSSESFREPSTTSVSKRTLLEANTGTLRSNYGDILTFSLGFLSPSRYGEPENITCQLNVTTLNEFLASLSHYLEIPQDGPKKSMPSSPEEKNRKYDSIIAPLNPYSEESTSEI